MSFSAVVEASKRQLNDCTVVSSLTRGREQAMHYIQAVSEAPTQWDAAAAATAASAAAKLNPPSNEYGWIVCNATALCLLHHP